MKKLSVAILSFILFASCTVMKFKTPIKRVEKFTISKDGTSIKYRFISREAIVTDSIGREYHVFPKSSGITMKDLLSKIN